MARCDKFVKSDCRQNSGQLLLQERTNDGWWSHSTRAMVNYLYLFYMLCYLTTFANGLKPCQQCRTCLRRQFTESPFHGSWVSMSTARWPWSLWRRPHHPPLTATHSTTSLACPRWRPFITMPSRLRPLISTARSTPISGTKEFHVWRMQSMSAGFEDHIIIWKKSYSHLLHTNSAGRSTYDHSMHL